MSYIHFPRKRRDYVTSEEAEREFSAVETQTDSKENVLNYLFMRYLRV